MVVIGGLVTVIGLNLVFYAGELFGPAAAADAMRRAAEREGEPKEWQVENKHLQIVQVRLRSMGFTDMEKGNAGGELLFLSLDSVVN